MTVRTMLCKLYVGRRHGVSPHRTLSHGPRCVFVCVCVCLCVFVCVLSSRCLVCWPSHLCVCRVGTPPTRKYITYIAGGHVDLDAFASQAWTRVEACLRGLIRKGGRSCVHRVDGCITHVGNRGGSTGIFVLTGTGLNLAAVRKTLHTSQSVPHDGCVFYYLYTGSDRQADRQTDVSVILGLRAAQFAPWFSGVTALAIPRAPRRRPPSAEPGRANPVRPEHRVLCQCRQARCASCCAA